MSDPRLAWVQSWRNAWRQWWQSRLPLADQTTLTQRNVYILPTRSGLMLALTLLILLVTSINYQLNLGYLLTFSLAGSTLVGMHLCHANLRRLSLRLAPPTAQFCNASAVLEIRLSNPGRRTRHGIGLALHDTQDWVWTDVPALGESTVHVAFQPHRRGWHPLPMLTAQTRFPMGAFRAWTLWRPAARVLVYPAPETHPPPLPTHPAAGTTAGMAPHRAQAGDPDGVRPYRRGDSMRQVVWKKAALALATGSDALVSRDHEPQPEHMLWLDHRHTGTLSLEHQLSRLCAWVLQADRLGLPYGLRLPAREILPASGARHRIECLEALALC